MAIFITESYTVPRKDRKEFEYIVSTFTQDDDFNNGFDIDKNRIEYLKIYHDDNGKPIGFGMLDRYVETGTGKILNVTLGILREYRGRGLGRTIGQDCINFWKPRKEYARIYWGCRNDNYKSASLARSLGFVYLSESDGYTCYMIER